MMLLPELRENTDDLLFFTVQWRFKVAQHSWLPMLSVVPLAYTLEEAITSVAAALQPRTDTADEWFCELVIAAVRQDNVGNYTKYVCTFRSDELPENLLDKFTLLYARFNGTDLPEELETKLRRLCAPISCS